MVIGYVSSLRIVTSTDCELRRYGGDLREWLALTLEKRLYALIVLEKGMFWKFTI